MCQKLIRGQVLARPQVLRPSVTPPGMAFMLYCKILTRICVLYGCAGSLAGSLGSMNSICITIAAPFLPRGPLSPPHPHPPLHTSHPSLCPLPPLCPLPSPAGGAVAAWPSVCRPQHRVSGALPGGEQGPTQGGCSAAACGQQGKWQ